MRIRLECLAYAANKANFTGASPLEPLRLVRVLAWTRVYERRNVEATLLLRRRCRLLDRRLGSRLRLVVHRHQVVEHSVTLLELILRLGHGRSGLDVRRLDRVRGSRLKLLRSWLREYAHRLWRKRLGRLGRWSGAAEHVQKVLYRLGLHWLRLRHWLRWDRDLDLRHLRNMRKRGRGHRLGGRDVNGLRLLLRNGGRLRDRLLASALHGWLVRPSGPLSLDIFCVDPLLAPVVVVLAGLLHSGREVVQQLSIGGLVSDHHVELVLLPAVHVDGPDARNVCSQVPVLPGALDADEDPMVVDGPLRGLGCAVRALHVFRTLRHDVQLLLEVLLLGCPRSFNSTAHEINTGWTKCIGAFIVTFLSAGFRRAPSGTPAQRAAARGRRQRRSAREHKYDFQFRLVNLSGISLQNNL